VPPARHAPPLEQIRPAEGITKHVLDGQAARTCSDNPLRICHHDLDQVLRVIA
jgi:hypothetical protein